jgi:hypothetical protein
MPPKVVCTGDQMTISANNSTLSSVLAEVHRCMGTKIDLPDGAGEKRMFDRIGPAPASQVLESLLSNTGYNYIIGSSPANEDKIESIVLLARAADANAVTTAITDRGPMNTNRRAFMQMHQASIPHPMTDADNAAAAAANAGEVTAPDSVTPAEAPPVSIPAPADASATQPAAAQPADTTNTPVQPQTTPAQPPASAPTVQPGSSTADQITNMQQMFELRKQMNQNQAPPNSTPAPPQ